VGVVGGLRGQTGVELDDFRAAETSLLSQCVKGGRRDTGSHDTRVAGERHSAGKALANCGVPPVVLKNFMGHASAAFSIDVYGHVSAGDLNDAAALLSAYRDRSLAAPTPVTSIAARDDRGIVAGSNTTAAAS
jgi:hypothetical protein